MQNRIGGLLFIIIIIDASTTEDMCSNSKKYTFQKNMIIP